MTFQEEVNDVVNLPLSTRPSHPPADTEALIRITYGHICSVGPTWVPWAPVQYVIYLFIPRYLFARLVLELGIETRMPDVRGVPGLGEQSGLEKA